MVRPTRGRNVAEARFRSAILLERRPGLAERALGLLSTGFAAVVRVGDERSLLETAGRLGPEVVLADTSFSLGGDLGWVGRLRDCCPRARLILLSDHDEPSLRTADVESGAHWLVLERSPTGGFAAALREIAGGPLV
jgi:two-component system secretion response regulator SsrB